VEKFALDMRTVDWPHVHIMINHFPIILTIVGTVALLFAMLRGQRTSWLYGTISLALAALTVIPSYFTGEPAEEALHRPWWLTRGTIHAHESAAKISGILVLVAGLVAVIIWRRLVRYPREVKLPGALRAAVLIPAIAASAAIGYASWLGGKIVHDAPVLQGPAPAGYVQPGAPIPPIAAPAATTPGTPADSTTPAPVPPATVSPAPARPQP
jgi:uncharacterized membrane protein